MELTRQERETSLETLRELKRLVDSAVEYMEVDGLLVRRHQEKPMAYDFVFGGRFGVIDIRERDRLEKEWRGKKRYPRFRGVKNLQRLFAASYE